jgi:putative lipoprotein (rSAM/lipoprotein system)
MKTNRSEKKRKILRTIFGTLSLTTAVFVFQACYGTPEDFGMDVCITGCVKSKDTNQPIKGIRVSIENQPQYEVTNEEGHFAIYAPEGKEYKLSFEDIDSTQNGSYLPNETILKLVDNSTYLEVKLDAK